MFAMGLVITFFETFSFEMVHTGFCKHPFDKCRTSRHRYKCYFNPANHSSSDFNLLTLLSALFMKFLNLLHTFVPLGMTILVAVFQRGTVFGSYSGPPPQWSIRPAGFPTAYS